MKIAQIVNACLHILRHENDLSLRTICLISVSIYSTDDVNIDDHNDAIVWLGKSTTPWKTVISKWRLTAPGRLSQFDESEISIEDYYAEFPALKVSEAGDLVRF